MMMILYRTAQLFARNFAKTKFVFSRTPYNTVIRRRVKKLRSIYMIVRRIVKKVMKSRW